MEIESVPLRDRSLGDLMTYGLDPAYVASIRRQRAELARHRNRLAAVARKKMPRQCHYCSVSIYMSHDDIMKRRTKDHIVPRSRGGQDRIWNIVDSCRACNTKKDSDLPTCQCSQCKFAVQKHFDFIIEISQGDDLVAWSYERKIIGLVRPD